MDEYVNEWGPFSSIEYSKNYNYSRSFAFLDCFVYVALHIFNDSVMCSTTVVIMYSPFRIFFLCSLLLQLILTRLLDILDDVSIADL